MVSELVFWPCPNRVCEVVNDFGVSCTPVARVWIIHNHGLPASPVVVCFRVLFCGTATLNSGPVGMSFRKAGVGTRFVTGHEAWQNKRAPAVPVEAMAALAVAPADPVGALSLVLSPEPLVGTKRLAAQSPAAASSSSSSSSRPATAPSRPPALGDAQSRPEGPIGMQAHS